jgi:hypothetical protein
VISSGRGGGQQAAAFCAAAALLPRQHCRWRRPGVRSRGGVLSGVDLVLQRHQRGIEGASSWRVAAQGADRVACRVQQCDLHLGALIRQAWAASATLAKAGATFIKAA